MKTLGAYEAKTNLAQLLDEVVRGERVIITRHGRPVAVLEAYENPGGTSAAAAAEQLRQFRKGRKLGRTPLRQLIEEGRS